MQFPVDSPFYRVSVKALIFDDQKRLLVFKDDKGHYEMPGGGWEHGESYQECLARELKEEADVVAATIGGVKFVYVSIHPKGYHKLCVAVPVTLASHDFVPGAIDNLVEARFVTKEEFQSLPFESEEHGVKDYVDQIWT